MQKDQMMVLLQDRIQKVVLLTKKLREENNDLRHQLEQANERFKTLEYTSTSSRFENEETQKSLTEAIHLLDNMISSSDCEISSDENERTYKYLAGQEVD